MASDLHMGINGLLKPGDKTDIGLTRLILNLTDNVKNSPQIEEPIKMVGRQIIENPADDELKRQVKSIKSDIMKLIGVMKNGCDVETFRDRREKIHHKCANVMPRIDKRNEETFKAVKSKYRSTDKHRHQAWQELAEQEIEHGPNIGLRNMPFDVTEASQEQLNQLFSRFPSFKYVHDRDAAGICEYLAKNCPLFEHATESNAFDTCKCLELTLINEPNCRPRSPLQFAVANNNYKFLRDLNDHIRENSHLFSIISSWVGYEYDKLVETAIFNDFPVKQESERNKLIKILCDSKYVYSSFAGEKELSEWYLSRDVTIMTDYRQNVYYENFFSLCLANNHWEVCKQAFILNQSRLTIQHFSQFLIDLVNTGQVNKVEEFMRERLVMWLVRYAAENRLDDNHGALFPRHFPLPTRHHKDGHLRPGRRENTETFLHAAFKTNNPDMVNLTFQFLKAFLVEKNIDYNHIRDHDRLTIPEMASYHEHREMTVIFENLNVRYAPQIEEYYGLMEGSGKCEEVVEAIVCGQSKTYDDLPILSVLVGLVKDDLAHKILRHYYTQPTAEPSVIADINEALISALYPGFHRLYYRSPNGSFVYDYMRMLNMVAMLLAAGAQLFCPNILIPRVPAEVKKLVHDVQKLNEQGIYLQEVFPLETAHGQLTEIIDQYI